MKLIVGLGNPGEKYKNNRHNVGFMTVDYICRQSHASHSRLRPSGLRTGKPWDPKLTFHKNFNAEIYKSEDKIGSVLFVKPQTFMNESGIAVSKVVSFYKIEPENICVIHDDLDIKLGEYKIQKATGPKVHGGILSIETLLGTKDFWRVRIGVDNRDPQNRLPGEAYVLQDFTKVEFEKLHHVFTAVKDLLVKLALSS